MLTCSLCQKELKNTRALSGHIRIHHPEYTNEKYYIEFMMKSIDDMRCPVCNKLNKFSKLSKGFNDTCSLKCAQLNPKTKEKIKQTNLKNYGVESHNSSSIIKEKKKEKYLNKYGVDNPSKSKKIQNSKKLNYFNRTLNSDRLDELVAPLFDISNYNGVSIENKYEFICLKCNNIFEDHLDNGRIPRCKLCFPSNISKSEQEIFNFIKINLKNIDIIQSDRIQINPYELDIYIPEKNLAIEFNGLYWHSELLIEDKNYHLNKTNLCKEKGIQLIHIFEDEWIYKSDIVKSILLNKLGLIPNKIYARKCEIKEVSSKDSKPFLEDNHIQGYIPSKYKLGLYYNEELISLLTIGQSRFNKNYDYELHRYCSKINTNVIGGFSKLLKHFRKNNSGSIITYADLRYGTGDVYLNNGFSKLKSSKPNYFYFRLSSIKRESRNKYQKHKLKNLLENFDSKLTEYENMKNNNYERIWDCGNNVFEFI